MRRYLLMLMLVLAVTLALLGSATAWPAWLVDPQAQARRDSGAAIFAGRQPLPGHLRGDGMALPTQATRCTNCHATDAGLSADGIAGAVPTGAKAGTVTADGQAPATGAPAAANFAPRLNATQLAQALPRRGGPPSRYDATSLCRLLRTGVDPAGVMVQRAMPLFEASDADCQALWQYLGTR